ncbi:MFS transporter [Microbacterium sp. SD291]|uniref:MFS transporter n=1 Tax=Microbacterium sp. SD291 TaxID=2782007 RepID=UPI0035ABFB8F
MLATGLIAIDATILATAVPSIVRDLGSYQQFPWLFSIYLLAQGVSVPIYSRFADTVGRKPIILLGIGLFLLGSILCGFAWSMPALIVFRLIQGLGAGAVAPGGSRGLVLRWPRTCLRTRGWSIEHPNPPEAVRL